MPARTTETQSNCTASIASKLVEDYRVAQPVHSNGQLAVVRGPSGKTRLFSIGEEGVLYVFTRTPGQPDWSQGEVTQQGNEPFQAAALIALDEGRQLDGALYALNPAGYVYEISLNPSTQAHTAVLVQDVLNFQVVSTPVNFTVGPVQAAIQRYASGSPLILGRFQAVSTHASIPAQAKTFLASQADAIWLAPSSINGPGSDPSGSVTYSLTYAPLNVLSQGNGDMYWLHASKVLFPRNTARPQDISQGLAFAVRDDGTPLCLRSQQAGPGMQRTFQELAFGSSAPAGVLDLDVIQGGDGRYVAAALTANQVWVSLQQGGDSATPEWGAWAQLASQGSGYTRLRLETDEDGLVQIFLKDSGGTLSHARQDSTSTAGFTAVLGFATSIAHFNVGRASDGTLELFTVTTDGKLHVASPDELGQWRQNDVSLSTNGVLRPFMAYSTKLSVLDANQAPAPGVTVSIRTAAGVIDARINGQPVTLNPRTPATAVTSSGLGEVNLVSEAYALSTAGLVVTSDAFITALPTHYPDHEVHTWFQQLDATTLAQARKKDGTPLVPADKAGDMVKQIQMLMKVQQRATGGARGTGSRRVGFDSPVDLGLPGDIDKWLEDNGSRIGDVVLGTLSDGTIVGKIEGLTNFASRFIVKTVEDAFDVVALLFYRYAATFQEVIHWVAEAIGMLFMWEDILATHRRIKTWFKEALLALPSQVNMSSLRGQAPAFFQEQQSGLNQLVAFSLDLSPLGTKALLDLRGGSSSLAKIFTVAGSFMGIGGDWVITKIVDAISSLTSGSGEFPAALTSAGSALRSALVTSLAPNRVSVDSQGIGLAESAKSGWLLSAQMKQLAGDYKSVGETAFNVLSSTSGALCDFLEAFIHNGQALYDFFDQLELHVPVLSELFSQLTQGGTLSLLDLCVFAAAVPTTLICKALDVGSGQSAAASSPRGDGSTPTEKEVAYTCFMVAWGVLNALFDDLPEDAEVPWRVQLLPDVLLTITLALSQPFSEPTTESLLLWGSTAAIVALDMSLIALRAGQQTTDNTNSAILFMAGTAQFFMIDALWCLAEEPSSKETLLFTEALLGAVVTMLRMLKAIPDSEKTLQEMDLTLGLAIPTVHATAVWGT
ncbi:MAG: hypothetical protein JXB05_27530 [Myxococcaceae bacterium]|nr:hypothetical protein [Myxococcaceae bacterium]